MKIEIKQGLSDEQIKSIFDNALKRWEVVAFDNDGNPTAENKTVGIKYDDIIEVEAFNGEPYFEKVYWYAIGFLDGIKSIMEKYDYVIIENEIPKTERYFYKDASFIQPYIEAVKCETQKTVVMLNNKRVTIEEYKNGIKIEGLMPSMAELRADNAKRIKELEEKGLINFSVEVTEYERRKQ